MRFMSRNFIRSEKILLLVLALVLIGLIYYRFVFRTVNDSIESSKAEKASIETDLEVAKGKAAKLAGMQDELDEIKGTDKATKMASYNNSKEETDFLSSILSDTNDYLISFSDVTRDGDQIRRSFTLQYTTTNYNEAERIMSRLCNGENRCLIGDINCNIDSTGKTRIDLTATFFETMVGGVPDSGLPKDEDEETEKVDLYNQEFNY